MIPDALDSLLTNNRNRQLSRASCNQGPRELTASSEEQRLAMDRTLGGKLVESEPEPPRKRARVADAVGARQTGNIASPSISSPVLYHPRPLHSHRPPFLKEILDQEPLNSQEEAPGGLIWNWINFVENHPRSLTTAPASSEVEEQSQSTQIPRPASAPHKMQRQFTPVTSFPSSPVTRAGSSSRYGSPRQSTSSGRDIENVGYRTFNCLENGVSLVENPFRPLPQHIARTVADTQKNRLSPGPSIEQLQASDELFELRDNAPETRVEEFFKEHEEHRMSTRPHGDALQRNSKMPMKVDDVPNNPGTDNRITTPVPDLIYSYHHERAFSMAQRRQLRDSVMAKSGMSEIYFPYFIIEFKGYNRCMSVATNQCLGGSATCVRMAERLNEHLKALKSSGSGIRAEEIETTAFSLSMSGSEARLHVTWKEADAQYKMQHIGSYVVQEPPQYIELRKRIRNIIDWGRQTRLAGILQLLDQLAEEKSKPLRQQPAVPTGPSMPAGGNGTGA
ncbi:hypothetical protein F503_00454 [Ophiostoma piceae UAMH 11346]|uniref:DUF7924 domain-containing protein n=1 Tax=Ophiostoma piceae (strain UAMH 11346) TaxID=1262450 RepID=S3C4M0_OPHP1|nr:hypothetical protein F503_00454 [Ophiostoma piceae UAMH 11346]